VLVATIKACGGAGEKAFAHAPAEAEVPQRLIHSDAWCSRRLAIPRPRT